MPPGVTEGDRPAAAREPFTGLDRLVAAPDAAASGDESILSDFLAERSWVRTLTTLFGAEGPAGGWSRAALLQALDRAVAEIDEQLSRQLDAILHHRRFQRLEASWRSLRTLVRLADSYENTKIRVLHMPWAELCRDLERAIEFDQSQIFQKIYSEEFGMPGGEPFGLLVGDYEVTHRRTADHPTDDIAALRGMTQVAAAALAPFVVAAAATLPYGDDGTRFDDFCYCEAVDDDDASAHLWASAAYAFAAVVMRSFGGSGWFVDMRGARRERILSGDRLQPHGGLVTHLPRPAHPTDRTELAVKYSTDVALSERQEKDLSDLGFIPLVKAHHTAFSVFYSNQSVQSARQYESATATANARISTMLQYMLCVGRFAHYVKVIARDRVGSFSTPEQCEDYLTKWLREYCNGNSNPSPELMARCPLRQARVQVSEPPGRPGSYQCVIHLRPHSQVDQIVSEFKLVTELAPRAA
jgi:type VI secretion system protein ImpD